MSNKDKINFIKSPSEKLQNETTAAPNNRALL